MPWSRTKRFHNLDEMANGCRQNFNACNETSDMSQQVCKQNIVFHHFELESFHFYDWTRVHTMVDFKNIQFQSFKRIHQTCQIQKNPFWRATSKISGFSPSNEFTKPVRSRKIHSGERLQKYPVSVLHTNSPNLSDPEKSILERDFRNLRFRCADSLVSYGREPDSYENVRGFKNVRIRVDGALNRSGERFQTKRFW